MPIERFNNETFVAFTDISGFKELMKNEENAVRALNHLNKTGYSVLQDTPTINGIIISDSGILFSRNNGSEGLLQLLSAIQLINRKMLRFNLMLTTSIAYGSFR